MKSLLPIASCLSFFLLACAPADRQQQSVSTISFALARPKVVIEADPPPPFTYWANEGSTIRNHPRQAGIWIAQAVGQPGRYYFGDQCHASRYQHLVGRPLADMPEAPQGQVWRTHCSSCAVTQDLAMTRMNISFNEKSRTIDAIACG
ncbi:hypothetical protein [Novosphingobium sp.]|uniref:hypothetical protein n=1 Tax=Novosphingobium sp. TaxID=1874826 RepID=UPI002FDEA5B8